MRVKLIVTGMMERRALHRSLARQFPVKGTGEPVEFLLPSYFQGPTSNPLPDDGSIIPQLVREFCDALVAETLEGSEPGGKPPDLVIGIDDLELENLDRPQVVTGWIRRGIEDHFARNIENSRADERRREALASKCSFHLLVPMPEAYFFGERAALERAGVAKGIEARVCRDDLEAFETNDPEFVPRPNRPTDHRHPKAYLKHLLDRSESGRLYKETANVAASTQASQQDCINPPRDHPPLMARQGRAHHAPETRPIRRARALCRSSPAIGRFEWDRAIDFGF